MTRIQGSYFSIDADKLQQVIAITGKPSIVQAWLINYDWPNATEHQEWLDTAPVTEIVSWLCEAKA